MQAALICPRRGPRFSDMSGGRSYFDTSGWDRSARRSGGSRQIPISTPAGDFHVWTRRIGNNQSLKVLLLHGGPGGSSEWFEPFDVWLPPAGIEYYHDDQLGSLRSDQPDDPSLWTLDRFVDEVEQVCRSLGLDGATSCFWATPGVVCWRWSTPCPTRSTSRASSWPTWSPASLSIGAMPPRSSSRPWTRLLLRRCWTSRTAVEGTSPATASRSGSTWAGCTWSDWRPRHINHAVYQRMWGRASFHPAPRQPSMTGHGVQRGLADRLVTARFVHSPTLRSVHPQGF